MRECAHCGAKVPEVNAHGLCPRCAGGGVMPPRAAEESGDSLAMSSAADSGAAGGPAPVPVMVRYLGDYELLEEIGRGGMGVVYKARQVSLNRLVAVKMILAGQYARESEIKRFRTEAEAAANLQHPGIVTIYEVGEHEGHQYYSMDYVEGDSLAGLMRKQSLPLRDAVEMMMQIARAVHYANQRGIIHRDLKPSNILVDGQGQPKVVDFGLAKQSREESRRDLTLSGAVLGTPAYMSPEQAQGKSRQISAATDVYSLGAILYHLVAGRPPFAEESAFATLKAVVEQVPPKPSQFNPALDPDLESVCLKCLRKQPERRYTSAEALAQDLERWLNREPVSARPTPPWQRAVMWRQRHPVVFKMSVACAMALVACAILAGIVVWQAKQGAAHGGGSLASGNRSQGGPTTGLTAGEMAYASQNPKDGIPFAWRVKYFGARNVASAMASATADPDRDGAINYQEFLAGTNPADDNSIDLRPASVSTYSGSVLGTNDGTLATATYYSPSIIKRDAKGRIWVVECTASSFFTSEAGSHRIKVLETNGTVITVAGADDYGLADGQGRQARFRFPTDIAFDRNGNAYVADCQNDRIRRIDTNWMVSTYAGSTRGFVNGPRAAAQFGLPYGIVTDANDNIYVADFDNLAIRKITPEGDVTTFAGGTRGFADGARQVARFNTPYALAFDSIGNLWVSDWMNGAIRKIDTNGRVSTPITGLGYSEQLAIDSQDNIYAYHILAVGSHRTLEKFTSTGKKLWGLNAANGFRDGPIDEAIFGHLSCPVEMPDKSLLFADGLNSKLRQIMQVPPALVTFSPAGGPFTNALSIKLSSAVANSQIRYTLDGRPPTTNSPAYSSPLILTQSASIQVVLFVNNLAVSLPIRSDYESVPSGPADGIPIAWRVRYFGSNNVESARAAAIADPDGDRCVNYQEWLAGTSPVDANSNDLKPQAISTYAGSEPGLRDGPLATALFHSPGALKRDLQGRLWILESSITGFWTSDQAAHCVRIIDANGIVSTLAGGTAYGLNEGSGQQARFKGPSDVAFDSHGNAFITDFQNNRIRKIDPNGVVSTFAGSIAGNRDGVGTNAQFSLPNSLVVDRENNVFVSDFDNLRICKITPDGNVTTYAGGIRGYLDGDRREAQFNSPSGLSLAPDGSLLVGDWINGAVRRISTNGMVSTLVTGMRYVERLHVDKGGNLYVAHADGTRANLRKFSSSMQPLWKISCLYGFRDGDISSAQFGSPATIQVLTNGNILMADQINSRLRLITVNPPPMLTLEPTTPVFADQVTLAMRTGVTNGVVRYTLDGSNPSPRSPVYSVPIVRSNAFTVCAAVFVKEYQVSPITKAAYTKAQANER